MCTSSTLPELVQHSNQWAIVLTLRLWSCVSMISLGCSGNTVPRESVWTSTRGHPPHLVSEAAGLLWPHRKVETSKTKPTRFPRPFRWCFGLVPFGVFLPCPHVHCCSPFPVITIIGMVFLLSLLQRIISWWFLWWMASWTTNLLDQNNGWLWVFFISFVSPCIFDNTNNPGRWCNYFMTPCPGILTILLHSCFHKIYIWLLDIYYLSPHSVLKSTDLSVIEYLWFFLTQEFSNWTYSIKQLKKVNSSKKNKVKLKHSTVKKINQGNMTKTTLTETMDTSLSGRCNLAVEVIKYKLFYLIGWHCIITPVTCAQFFPTKK